MISRSEAAVLMLRYSFDGVGILYALVKRASSLVIRHLRMADEVAVQGLALHPAKEQCFAVSSVTLMLAMRLEWIALVQTDFERFL